MFNVAQATTLFVTDINS